MSIEAMKQALDFLEWFAGDDHSIRPKHKAPEIAAALRQAIAEAEKQEPVAWMEHMPVEGENVAKSVRMTSSKVVAQMLANPIPLYKGLSEYMFQATNGQVRIDPVTGNLGIGTPPAAQRTWVGLTDEEITESWSWAQSREAEHHASTGQHAFAYAIEAKLKDKNA
jgi:hypothetical protein